MGRSGRIRELGLFHFPHHQQRRGGAGRGKIPEMKIEQLRQAALS
jgi:hypothetical protein